VKFCLVRQRRSDQGTEGVLVFSNWWLNTIELPWRDNRRNVSCIPSGRYFVKWAWSKFGLVPHVLDVPNRSGILIHVGNWAGDREKGYRSDTYGCILVGLRRGELFGQRAVLMSSHAFAKLKSFIGMRVFVLEVIE